MIDRRGLLAAAAVSGLWPASLAAKPATPYRPLVDAVARDHGFQGVVLLGRRGRALYAQAVGQADIAGGLPATRDTAYAIASISKLLTTVTVLRLVETGRLDLDAPITRYLPDYRADTGARVSLRRLLSNTSGVPNLFTLAVKADPTLMTLPLSTAEAVRRFCEGDLIFEPGARFDYALTNWILVIAIVEAVTGQPFASAMRRITLDPLGLRATATAGERPDRPGVALSYRTVDPPVVWTSGRQPYLAAGGGYISTADDLLRAAHLIFDTGFLSRPSRRALTTIEAPSDHYALGGRVRAVTIGGAARDAAWDTGNTAGYRSVLGHRLDDGSTVVILNNTALSQRLLDEFADSLLVALAA